MANRKSSVSTPAATNYRFRLVHGEVEFEVEGDRQFVLDHISKYAPPVAGDTNRKPLKPSTAETSLTRVTPKSEKGLSVREFIRLFDLKKHTEYVLGFGYFLEKYGGQESFTPADINSLYYEAKIESSNTSQMLIQNIKRGFVMEAKNSDGGRKKFVLTTSGERYVEERRIVAAE